MKISVFCGAGISYNSGLPLAHDLLRKICEVLCLNLSETNALLDSNLPFESFIEILHQEVSIEGILDVFELGQPNSNHLLFGKMLKTGIIRSVCTTNFDRLLEKGLESEGCLEGERFDCYHSETHFRDFSWDDEKPKLIKLHGCVSDRKQLGITLDVVAGVESSVYRNELVKDFFSKKCNDVVIVIGYSCSDIFDISPQIRSVEEEKSEIIFVEHQNGLEDYLIEDFGSVGKESPFVNYPGFSVKVDADHFVKLLWKSTLEEDLQIVQGASNWQQDVERWMIDSVKENTIGVKSHLPARLFYHICDYPTSLRFCEQGKKIAQELGDFRAYYSEMGNAGMALNAMGRLDEAKEYLTNSIIGCRMVSNDQGVIAQSEVLGHIHRNLRDYDSALRWFREALQAAETLGEPFSICTSIGNLCSVYNHLGHTSESIQLVNRGIDLARQIGNKQSEGAMLCHLGIAYFQQGQWEKSRSQMRSSLELARSIGDVRSEAMVCVNLGNLEMNCGNYSAAIDFANKALSLAEKWGFNEIAWKARLLIEMSDSL